ncbi:MAG: CBS domain-containing protein [Rhodospirillales bacterium]
MRVSDIIKGKGNKVLGIKPETPLCTAARLMSENWIGSVLVCSDGGRMMGILFERDLVRAMAENPGLVSKMKAEDVYNKHPATCSPDDSLETAMNIMSEKRCRHMPVIENGALKGIISIGDVFKYLLDQVVQTQDDLLWTGTTDLM